MGGGVIALGQSVATSPTRQAIGRSSLIMITSLSGGRGATESRPCSELRAATGLCSDHSHTKSYLVLWWRGFILARMRPDSRGMAPTGSTIADWSWSAQTRTN